MTLEAFARFILGQIIDNKYHLKDILGSGGEGVVLAADEVFLDELARRVAVKLYAPDYERLDRQKQEIITALNLNHPHLVRFFTAGQCQLMNSDFLYMVMERGEETVADRLQKSTISLDDTREIVQSVSEVLVYLHEKGIVHRDIKPSNILRIDDLWKLADLGLVRDVGSQGIKTSGLNQGTPQYAPPESYEGEICLTWDIWSLGVMIVEMITGELPFNAKTSQQLPLLVMTEDPQYPKPLPDPFDKIVEGCLIKDASKRWSAKQILEELSRAIIQEATMVQAIENDFQNIGESGNKPVEMDGITEKLKNIIQPSQDALTMVDKLLKEKSEELKVNLLPGIMKWIRKS
jgi:serine/threonine protein kinase